MNLLFCRGYCDSFERLFVNFRRWEDNIKIDPREIGIDWANGIQLAQIVSSGGLL
jgi:hypothetical protein